MATTLYHTSGWYDLSNAQIGSEFTLRPGWHNAEGVGIYFSADRPVVATTAEGAYAHGAGSAAAVVIIEAPAATGWWRTKPAIARKFGRPITWHTDGKSVACRVVDRQVVGGVVNLKCEWSFA